jgi:hypothetical protein
MPDKLSTADRAVLTILAGCPSGATEFNLVTRHEVKPATLFRLIERGLIHPEERRIRPPWGWPILWVRITEHGRAALNKEVVG